MILQAVAMIVQAIGSVATSVIGGQNQKNAQFRAEMQDSIDYEQEKNLSFYNAYKVQNQALMLITVMGFVFLIFIIYMTLKRAKT